MGDVRKCGTALKCQREHWENGHREECISLVDQARYKRVVSSGLPRQMNQAIHPSVDAAMYSRGVSSGAYRDRSVKLGQGVTIYMTGADGYIVEVQKDDQVTRHVMGKVVGLNETAQAFDAIIAEHAPHVKLDGLSSFRKLFEQMMKDFAK